MKFGDFQHFAGRGNRRRNVGQGVVADALSPFVIVLPSSRDTVFVARSALLNAHRSRLSVTLAPQLQRGPFFRK